MCDFEKNNQQAENVSWTFSKCNTDKYNEIVRHIKDAKEKRKEGLREELVLDALPKDKQPI